MRLIDAGKLNAEIYRKCFEANDERNVLNLRIRYKILEKTLRDAPTIDAVPVIRCKDCKYWDGYYCHNKWWGDGYGNYTPPIKNEDGFCDWAERKEE